MEKQFESKEGGTLRSIFRIKVPKFGDIRILVLDEAHRKRYLVHLGIATYVSKCLTCTKVKEENQKPSGLLQQSKIPEWKWEQVSMDFITKLLKMPSGYDMI